MIEKLNNYYLGCGGFGDLLLTMSTFYDEIEKNDIVWFADNKKFIEEALNIFPKFQNKIVFTKDNTFSSKWFKFANHEKCQGTGITPKNLDYSEWKDVNIFEKYKVNSFPNFAQDYEKIKLNEEYICIMLNSTVVPGKAKELTYASWEKLVEKIGSKKTFIMGNSNPKFQHKYANVNGMKLKDQLKLIRGASEVYSVDSWVKTFSSLCGIPTYCYDNIYSQGYLDSMGGTDWGHYIFIFPFKNITFIKQ